MWGRSQTSKSKKHGDHPLDSTKTTFTKAYHSQIHKIHREGKNYESRKGKKVLNLQGMTDQVHSRYVHRNMAAQKGVAEYIQCAELEKYAARNSLSSKAVIQNRRRGAPGWLSRLGVWLRLRSWSHSCGFEPHVGLCADSSEPGGCFRFCVSLSLCPSPVHVLSLSVSKINKRKKK